MLESLFLDRDWETIETDEVASWRSDDLRIEVSEMENRLDISLYRTVSADGYEAEIETLTTRVRTIDDAEVMVEGIVTDLDEIDSRVVAIGAEPGDVGDETFVHFYCVFESALPDGIEPEDLIFEDDASPGDGIATTSAMDVDPDEYEDGIRIEIYPVHEDHVTSIDE